MVTQMTSWTSCFLVMTLILVGCEEKPITIPEFVIPDSDRVVLIEEMTGVSCQGCPAGAVKIESLIQLFEDHVIAIGVHGSFLCEPIDGHSNFDFRFDQAKELEQSYFFLGKPSVIINRQQFDDQDFIGITNPDTWQSYVEQELQKPNYLTLLSSHTYDRDTRTIQVDIVGIPVLDLDGTFNISVMVLENHIVDAQKNGPDIQDNYEHNHVLRAILTERVYGDNFTQDLSVGDNITKSYTYTLPDDDGTWKDENIDIVAFISKKEANSEEILQAIKFHIIE